jgi:hypothetical protein
LLSNSSKKKGSTVPNVTVLQKFLAYRESLRDNLLQLPQVIGLVFVGSAADTSRVDKWSDHDFFVVTTPGSAEALRQDLSWLPHFEHIVLSPRETEHGLKVVFTDGRVLEFAIFEDAELELAGANDFAVFIDKANIQNRMDAIAKRSVPGAFDEVREFELFLCQLLIGVGRARRGEVLIAGQHMRTYALTNLLGLIRHWAKPKTGTQHLEDNLNRFRRFEKQYPAEAAQVEALLEQDPEACAKGMLELVMQVAATNFEGSNLLETAANQIATLKKALDWE